MRLKLTFACIAFVLGLAPAVAAEPSRVQAIIGGTCALCHGPDGESSSPEFPRLAGQHTEYLAKQLKDFRDGRRRGTMNGIVDDLNLTDADVSELASYFGRKKTHRHAVDDPGLVSVGKYIYEKGNKFSGVAACAGCHGPRGHGTAQLPRLAGQHADYLQTQLIDFIQRVRTNDNSVMHNVAAKLTALEGAAVSQYLSSLD